MEFDPEMCSNTPEVLVFRFRDGVGYRRFSEHAHEQESHIFVCDNRSFTVTTDAFTKEEALRLSKVTTGLSLISTVPFKGVESVRESEIIWSWLTEPA